MSIRSSCYRGLEHDDVLLPAGRLQLGPIGCIQQQPRDRRDHDGAPPYASWLIRRFQRPGDREWKLRDPFDITALTIDYCPGLYLADWTLTSR